MKKYLLFLFVPFAAIASECDDMKIDLQAQAQSLKNALPSLETDIIYTRSGVYSLSQKATEFQSLSDRNSDVDVKNAYNYAANSCRVSYQSYWPYAESLLQDYITISNRIYTLSRSIDSIDCSSCSIGSSSTNCCDFSQIIEVINNCSAQLEDIRLEVSGTATLVGQAVEWLEVLVPCVQSGFYDVTNILQNISKFWDSSRWSAKTMAVGRVYYAKRDGTYGEHGPITYTNPNTSGNGGILGAILTEDFYSRALLGSLNNYSYLFRTSDFPILTNNVGSISKGVSFITNELALFHEDTTNFFTFFRGEIGVEGVLEDWTNVEADGTYHDFLTNHYINVVRDGSLSGYSYEKTNWFSRVETLLAALVFRDEGDTTGTNLVDGARYDTEKQQINDALQDSISYLGAPVGKLQNMTEPLVSQLSVFSDAFSNAILPSHITLFSIGEGASRSSSTTPFDVTFMVDSEQQAYYQIIRSCTTLCWVFVSLLLIYWFLVWSINKIIVIVRFFWSVGEMFMSRNG